MLKSNIVLSICVPSYNRCKELHVFFKSILNCKMSSEFEIVLVDDGSTDDTAMIVDEFKNMLNILYYKQMNQGRSVALKNAILKASGKYTVLMDSDDYFSDNGLDIILKTIRGNDNNDAYVFGTKLVKGDVSRINIPPKNVLSNFVALRADLEIKGDLKEVVKTNIIKDCIYQVPEGCRRVPTSLLWARVSEQAQCLCIPEVVAIKEYLPGGMSDTILQLKTKNSSPMVELYLLLSESNVYKSSKYRFKVMLLWGRYSNHNGKVELKKMWQFLFVFLGYFVYLYDKFRLKIK